MEQHDENIGTTEIAGTYQEDSLSALYSAIEESARLLDVACSRDKVLPILTAYGDALAQAVIAFRVATGARHAGELDCRFTIPSHVDPYALALSSGFTTETGHPVGALLADIRSRCPIDCYGIDFGVVEGFKKIWPFFPPADLQGLSKLADIPSMPRSLGENINFFTRHGMGDKAGLIGIDYQNRTMNVYFGEQPVECFEPKIIRSMLRENEQPDPSEQMLKLCQKAFGIYVTLNWHSPKIERICFAVMTPDPTSLPVRLDPKIKKFVRHVQRSAANRRFVYAVTSSPDGEYYKLQSYYRWRPGILDLMQLPNDSIKDPV